MSKTQVTFYQKFNAVEFVPDNSYLVSLEVKSLYTSIPNAESIIGCTKVSRQPSKVNNGNKGSHNIILTLNNFVFNSRNYLQTKGCGMRTICAPSYANLFMDHFEKTLYTHLSKGSH